jgi:23S rRNA pseudouridine2605 synthase
MKQRLQVAIAHAGIASRRKAEELIEAGNVQLNGKTVKSQGIQVDPEIDVIVVNGKKITKEEELVYFIMNKKRGVVSTSSDPDGKKTVIDLFAKYWKKTNGEAKEPRLYPVGRLDEDSEGLILLTNDGELANRLTHPKFEIKKTYEVMIKGSPSNTALTRLKKGIKLKEGFAYIDDVRLLKHDQGNTWLTITIHQGMHHQIRRVLSMVGLEVSRLIRVKMGPLSLGDLKEGSIKAIEKPKI